MKKYETLSHQDHVMRYVKRILQHRDEDGNFIRCMPQAFALRDKLNNGTAEKELSVTHLENFKGTRQQQIVQAAGVTVSSIHKDKSKGFHDKDIFAIGNVGFIHTVCSKYGVKIRIISYPTKDNPAHVNICYLPYNNMELNASLESEAFTEIVSGKKLLAH